MGGGLRGILRGGLREGWGRGGGECGWGEGEGDIDVRRLAQDPFGSSMPVRFCLWMWMRTLVQDGVDCGDCFLRHAMVASWAAAIYAGKQEYS